MLSIQEFRALGLEGMSRCSKCGKIKPQQDFVMNSNRPTGYESRCKECHRKIGKKRRSTPEGRKKVSEYNRKKRQDPEHREYMRNYQRRRYQSDAEFRKKERKRGRQRKKNLRDTKSQPGYIYILQFDRWYKIGKTKDITNRITQITPNLPHTPTLIHSFPTDDMTETEYQLHTRFDHCRRDGEWFKLSEADLHWIAWFANKQKAHHEPLL